MMDPSHETRGGRDGRRPGASRRGRLARCFGALLAGLMAAVPAAASFVTFETGPVRPLAMSADTERLFVTNTPDGRLEIFAIASDGLRPEASVPVGLEPTAVAVRSAGEVWVVNHLSDSVSIVDVASAPPRVVRTLRVGDEPRDIVFAGPGRSRAFITTAHRGQHSPYSDADDPGEMTTPGIGRADVWVFDANDPGPSVGGDPLTVVTLFGDTPRALAVTPDGATVYAAVFHSGNGTTTVHQSAVCDGGELAAPCAPMPGEAFAPGGLPAPNENTALVPQPEVGLIVRFDGAGWRDELGRDWGGLVRFDLPDLDVFAIDALADPPVEVASYPHVGTVLFNMVVNPVSGALYVSGTQARNEVRFEGLRDPGDPTSTVVGHLHEYRVTVIDDQGVRPRRLNPHIDYDVVPSPPGVKEASLATPLDMVVSSDGQTLYLAAFGSSKIGVLDAAAIEDGSFVPSAADHIPVGGGGPAGIALDETRGRLYVLTRFDNAVSVIDLATRSQIATHAMHNPEPAEVVAGRPFLYDANLTSSNGEASCSSCHVFGRMDSLAWDLGDPKGDFGSNPNFAFSFFPQTGFHPLKGPMTTQSLRGLAHHGPMHWRGDRTGASQPGGSSFDEQAAFMAFNPAFVGLVGRDEQLTLEQMQAFTAFASKLTYPPNPNRPLDGSLTPAQQRGRDFFFNETAIDQPFGQLTCNACHVLAPESKVFGTAGVTVFSGNEQDFKIPHLRNVYQKIGMFGMPDVIEFTDDDAAHTGDQIRGFGLAHDGARDTVARLHSDIIFTPQTHAAMFDLEQFVLGFDTDLAPAVGQQVTLRADNVAVADPDLSLLIGRAMAGDCDLIVSGVIDGAPRSARLLTEGPDAGQFQGDEAGSFPLPEPILRAIATVPGSEMTYTCVPSGTGERMALDRDEDGVLNYQDNCQAVGNSPQLDGDGDGRGSACDNCTNTANPDQRDSNGDGFGNSCDADLDNDRTIDGVDLAIMRGRFYQADADADLNGDGRVNFLDLGMLKFMYLGPPGPSALVP